MYKKNFRIPREEGVRFQAFKYLNLDYYDCFARFFFLSRSPPIAFILSLYLSFFTVLIVKFIETLMYITLELCTVKLSIFMLLRLPLEMEARGRKKEH